MWSRPHLKFQKTVLFFLLATLASNLRQFSQCIPVMFKFLNKTVTTTFNPLLTIKAFPTIQWVTTQDRLVWKFPLSNKDSFHTQNNKCSLRFTILRSDLSKMNPKDPFLSPTKIGHIWGLPNKTPSFLSCFQNHKCLQTKPKESGFRPMKKFRERRTVILIWRECKTKETLQQQRWGS